MEKYIVSASILLTTLLFLSGCGNDAGPAVQTEENFILEALGAPFEIAVDVVQEVGHPDWDETLNYVPPTGVAINVLAVSPKTVEAVFTNYSDDYTGYTINGELTMVIINPTSSTIQITLSGTLYFTGGEISEITFNNVQTDIFFLGQPPASATGTVTVDGTDYPANTIIELFSA